jgi:hypothetical protein
MVKQNNSGIWIILGIVILVIILNSNGGLFSTVNNCPNNFRFVSYSPLTDAPLNFVSRITTAGQSCILKESSIQAYFQNISIIENECKNSNGVIVKLDGVVINGGYNYTGSPSGGCWSSSIDESNQRCASYTINNCPSDCKLINPSQTYYVDMPFCNLRQSCPTGQTLCSDGNCKTNCLTPTNGNPTDTRNWWEQNIFNIGTFQVQLWMLLVFIGGIFLIILIKR